MADYKNGISSVGTLSLVDKIPNIAHFLDVSNNINFNPGVTEEIVYAASELGVEQPVKKQVTREDPTMQVTVPRKSLEAISFATGRKWEEAQNVPSTWVRTFIPIKAEYAAKTAGYEGFGVAADPAGAIGSILMKEAVPELATRVPFGSAGTALVGTKSYAIGENGAMKFTPDLVGVPFAMKVPYVLSTAQILGEEYYRSLALVVTLLMDDKKLVQIEFNEASIVLDGSSLNFGEPGLQMTFRSMLTGEKCVGYEMRYLGLGRKC
jgi:hypothetical protein